MRTNAVAVYKYFHLLHARNDPAFDKECEPATVATWPGIYRCVGCGREIVCQVGHPLPPANHHSHLPHVGRIRWQLVVSYLSS
jgi:hypothetical protein